MYIYCTFRFTWGFSWLNINVKLKVLDAPDDLGLCDFPFLDQFAHETLLRIFDIFSVISSPNLTENTLPQWWIGFLPINAHTKDKDSKILFCLYLVYTCITSLDETY